MYQSLPHSKRCYKRREKEKLKKRVTRQLLIPKSLKVTWSVVKETEIQDMVIISEAECQCVPSSRELQKGRRKLERMKETTGSKTTAFKTKKSILR